MTPQITILALAFIAAALSVIAALQRVYINRLKADATYERFKAQKKAEHFEELLIEAKAESDNEYQLRRQAERNLAEANDEVDTWHARAMRAENVLSKYSRQRDPKTGRFVKPDWVSDESREAASKALEMDKGLAEFHNMMGNAIDQLNALTIRKMPDDMQTESALNMGRTLRLCDEVKENAGSGI